MSRDLNGVSLLGNQNTKYLTEYDPSVLEKFKNQHIGSDDVVSLDCFEFSSLCLAGDTMIDVATDETKNPDGIPIKDLVGTEGYVFGVNPDTLEPVCRKYFDVRKTQENAPVVRVVLEKMVGGQYGITSKIVSLVCTPDHLILVKRGFRDSEWVKAKDLQPGMRLIATQHYDDMIRGKARHRLIGEAIFDENLLDVHHKDGNHFNNDPSNLENKSTFLHQHDHRSEQYGYDNSLDVETLISLYNSGENFNSLAKLYKCDVSTIESRIGHLVVRRTQAESLKLKCETQNAERDLDMYALYEQGYLLSEIADYYQVHSTTVSAAIKRQDGTLREANFARYNRRSLNLPPLNHRVVKVVDAGTQDVYNMEVEDVHNFFANGVVVHNCPKTGQPDLATIYISYIPDETLVESKSLKLYLFSFRNHGDFHEDCVKTICDDLVELLAPKYLEVYGDFNSRGGVSILPFSSYANDDYLRFQQARKLDVMSKHIGHKPRTS